MTRTTPLRARRLNLPGRLPEDEDPADDTTTAPGEVDDDLAEMRRAFAENRDPSDPTPSAHYEPATTLSPSWRHDERDHTPDGDAPAPAATPSVPSVPGEDEWEALRESGDRADANAKRERTGDKGDKPTLTRTLLELPVLIVVAALIAFLVRTFVAQAFYIPSESMTPQLLKNDRIVVSKLAYRLHDPRRGDIVVFANPRQVPDIDGDDGPLPVRAIRTLGEAVGLVQPSTEDFIKRVIGLPGETVEGRDGKIFVNGRVLVEPYLTPGEPPGPGFPPTTVPEGQLWVMGDNRDGSSDSRVFGPIKRSSVVGRTVVRVWPIGDASFL